MKTLIEAAVLVGGVSLYLVPSIIADARERSDALAITLVNVFLGWTVIGWIAAFTWARRAEQEDRASEFVVKRQRATAHRTVEKIVAHAKSRAAFAASIARLSPHLEPARVRAVARRDRVRHY
jgi:hypothetical protein